MKSKDNEGKCRRGKQGSSRHYQDFTLIVTRKWTEAVYESDGMTHAVS